MLGGISAWQLLILLLIVVVVFGTKRLRNVGSDLGGAIKGFRKGMEDEQNDKDSEDKDPEQITTAEKSVSKPEEKKENAAASRPSDSDV